MTQVGAHFQRAGSNKQSVYQRRPSLRSVGAGLLMAHPFRMRRTSRIVITDRKPSSWQDLRHTGTIISGKLCRTGLMAKTFTQLCALLMMVTVAGTIPSIATAKTTAAKTASAKTITAKTAQRPIRIVIDPGHGGNNMGAIGPYGVHEKYVTLQIALKLGELLKASENVVVFYTRVADVAVSLPDRAEMANALDADLFLSIHCNAAENTEANGIETFYLGAGSDLSTKELAKRENGRDNPDADAGTDPDHSLDMLLANMEFNGNQNESALLAADIQRSLTKAFTDARNREVRQAPFTVLEHTNMPAVVIETGFITHVSEGRKLLMADHQQKLAATIQKAVISFVKNAEERPAFARQYDFEP